MKTPTNKYAFDFMPQNPNEQHVLDERRKQLAKGQIKKIEMKNLVEYVRFQLGEHEYYGIPYPLTKEVISKTTITSIPGAPDFIAGVINRRGIILTILDLKKFLQLPPSDKELNAYIITVDCNNIAVGLIVDKIIGSDAYDPTLLDAPLSPTGAIKPDYIEGIHHGKTAILNINTILSELVLQIGRK